MIYVTYFFAAAFIVLSGLMFFSYFRSRHFGLFILALTYGASGLLAIGLPHWWPLVTGFVLAWVLRLVGLEPPYSAPVRADKADENSEASRDADGGTNRAEGGGMRDEGSGRKEAVDK